MQPLSGQPLVRSIEEAPARPVRLLVVDDEPRLRHSLRLLLAQAGREVDECATGKQAVEALDLKYYDLVLLDLRLPDMTGLQVMDSLLSRPHSPTIIVVSADDVIDSAIGALRRGAYDFVRKPYQPEELMRTVDNALQRKSLERANALISEKLEQSERLHRYLVDHSPDLIYTVNDLGLFTYVNPTANTMLGYASGELIGLPYHSIVYEEDRDAARFAFCERRTGERASRNIELRLKRRPGGDAPESAWSDVLTIALSATGVYFDQKEGDGATRFVGSYGVARDISERKRAEERISFQAYHDLLTQLPNRALFKDRLSVALSQAQRTGRRVAVLFIDLDRFKLVNDSLGHAEGDELLKGVAVRLQACVRRSDTLARLGGDEFTILLPDLTDAEDAALISQKVIDELRRPLQLAGGQEIRPTASIGIALYPDDGTEAESLVKHADIAMYHVKSGGKDGYAFFSPDMNAAFHHKLTMETELRRALDQGELELRYQPQISLSRGRVIGVEALVRWNHPQRGLLLPDAFIGLAEEAGLITRLSDWVLDESCRQSADWRAAGVTDLRVSVNLSPRDFDRADVVDRVLAALNRHQVPPQTLDVEITENLMVRDTELVAEAIRQLSGKGVRVSIDDFGTRYASFGYLQRFPVTSLKLDQTFVRDLSAAHPYSPIIVAIVGIARGFDLHLVAEGVESELQRDVLIGLGCDEMQGFLFGAPMQAAQIGELLALRAPAGA